MKIILPVGISFYTFQALSYTIDVYQKKIHPTTDVIEFFAYISFFPQLVAGPIERATNLLPQFQKERSFDYVKSIDGCRQMLWGFFKKLVIADNCATIVNANWDHYQDMAGVSLFIIGVLFSFQIYCDFSGYSDIAIGCARLFGIQLKKNFNFPYFSRSIPEFWRRWHISLMTWFRDYVYFPLGGSRCGKFKTIRNVFIVWGISGLWHGANWTFVFWGLYHAIILNIYNIFGIKSKYNQTVAYRKYLPNLKELLQMSITFILTVIGWIIFRAKDLSQATDYILSMFTNQLFDRNMLYGKTLLFCLILLLIEWFQRDKEHALQFPNKSPFNYRFVRWTVYYSLILSIMILAGSSQTFIYFQF
jgi:D-alanyl-lipoteichoic acid acyltransferase DltB (MBOAT superfamily)